MLPILIIGASLLSLPYLLETDSVECVDGAYIWYCCRLPTIWSRACFQLYHTIVRRQYTLHSTHSCSDRHITAVNSCNPSFKTTAALIEPQQCTHLDHSVDEASTSGKPSSTQRSCSSFPSALEGPLKSSRLPGLRNKIFGSGNSIRSAVVAALSSPACAIVL